MPRSARNRGPARLALCILVAALAGPHATAAEEATTVERPATIADQPRPVDLVATSVGRVMTVLRSRTRGTPLTAEQREEIRRVAVQLFDFDEMARRTLAQHWNARSPAERTEFVRLFIDLLEQSYLTAIGNHPVTDVTFHGESINGTQARVRSRVVTARRAEILVDYHLLLLNGEGWQVYDVLADGVSVVSSYRSQFNAIIRATSFGQLLEHLRAKEAQASLRQGP
jgi:phospholipid transport system substrate-binding protein